MTDLPLSDWGIYVHIPFCRSRCTYCDFNTVTGMGEADHAQYMEALAAQWATEVLPAGRLVSVYFGGGTPSLVAPERLAPLLARLSERAGPLDGVEITLEANPGTVTPRRLEAYRRLGVNRLSVGVQALQDRHLLALNRAHSVEDVSRVVSWARAAGFVNVSLDAIYGLADQTDAEWRETVEGLIAMNPEHVSLYRLQVEEGTPLQIQVKRGAVRLPEEDRVADMADEAERRLVQAGYEAYEISNYARGGRYSRHNRLYWELNPYIGLGAGAHAFDGTRRWWNVRSVRKYMQQASAGLEVTAGCELLTEDMAMREYLWLGLRERAGVSRTRFSARFGEPPDRRFGDVLRRLHDLGMIEEAPERIRLTPRGWEVANQVFMHLV